MSPQVQCGNCGGYKVDMGEQSAVAGMMGIPIGGMIIAAGIKTLFGAGDLLLGLGILAVGVLLFLVGVGTFKNVAAGQRSFSCAICGHKWTGNLRAARSRQEDVPLRPIQADPSVQVQAHVERSPLENTQLIGRLAELRDRGALTDSEFESKKADLLRRI